jgi:hypothetical protein
MGFPEWPSFKIEPGSLLQDEVETATPINKTRIGLPSNKFGYMTGILSL